MKLYKRLNGNSGVTHYEITADDIKVRFNDGSVYMYNYSKTGKEHIIKMVELAQSGKGLSAYISKYVRETYALKIK